MRQYLVGVGVLSTSEKTPNTYVMEREAPVLAKFLNRLLGLPVHAQNALFGYFTDIIAELVRIAKGNGTFDKGIMGEQKGESGGRVQLYATFRFVDLGSGTDKAQKLEHREFRGFRDNPNFIVEMHKIGAERGVKWEDAFTLFDAQSNPLCGFYLSRPHAERKRMIVLVVSSGKSVQRHLNIVRPNSGRSNKSETIEDIEKRFIKVSHSEAETMWREQYEGRKEGE